MFILRILLGIVLLAIASVGSTQNSPKLKVTNKNDPKIFLKNAKIFLATINKENDKWSNKEQTASWNYESNLTDENLAKQVKVLNDAANFRKEVWKKVKALPWKELQDKDSKRQFKFYSNIMEASLPEKHFIEFRNIVNRMQTIYSTAKVCDYKNRKKCNLSLEPELQNLFAKSRDPELLKYIWLEWRKVSGKKIKPFFPRYVELSNEAARLNNFKDKSAMWLNDYEAADFQDQIKTILEDLKPLHMQIHAYVRRQLRKKYGDNAVSEDGLIPAHLLGNMWSESWENIADFTLPFPGKTMPDPTPAMVAQKYDALKVFKLAESSFISMNMSAMPELFWKNSIIHKPTDREIVCHPSAWDFYNGKDYRIKACTEINARYLETIQHEMGHIQYYMQYKDLPRVYKDGANPGFQEAVGDVMGLSVSTPAHLQKIKLLKNYIADHEASINHLYMKSLEKVVFLPFAYIMDLWRWNVFNGNISSDQYNCNWWKLAEEYQGIESPAVRTEEYLDPASKYHVAADIEYLRYCVAYIIQFQFYRALCMKAGEYNPNDPKSKPLHECDITSSTEAGNLFKSMLKMGSSKPWQDAMEVLTGQREMSSSGILDYFKPLQDWLTAENKKTNEFIGWKDNKIHCVKT